MISKRIGMGRPWNKLKSFQYVNDTNYRDIISHLSGIDAEKTDYEKRLVEKGLMGIRSLYWERFKEIDALQKTHSRRCPQIGMSAFEIANICIHKSIEISTVKKLIIMIDNDEFEIVLNNQNISRSLRLDIYFGLLTCRKWTFVCIILCIFCTLNPILLLDNWEFCEMCAISPQNDIYPIWKIHYTLHPFSSWWFKSWILRFTIHLDWYRRSVADIYRSCSKGCNEIIIDDPIALQTPF